MIFSLLLDLQVRKTLKVDLLIFPLSAARAAAATAIATATATAAKHEHMRAHP